MEERGGAGVGDRDGEKTFVTGGFQSSCYLHCGIEKFLRHAAKFKRSSNVL